MEKDISLGALLLYLIKNIKKLVVIGVAGAIVFMMIGGSSLILNRNDEKLMIENKEYAIKQKEYETSQALLLRNINGLRISLEDMEEYAKESIYYSLNANETYESTIVVNIDTNYQIMPDKAFQNADKTEMLVSAYEHAYKTHEFYEDARKLIGEKEIPVYFSEIISISREEEDNNLLTISAMHLDEKIASELVQLIFSHSEKAMKAGVGKDQEYTTTKVSEQTQKGLSAESADKLRRLRVGYTDEMNLLVTKLGENEKLYANNATSAPTNPSSTSYIVKQSIKYGVVGGFLSGVVAIFIFIFLYINRETIENEDMMLRYFKDDYLGKFTKTIEENSYISAQFKVLGARYSEKTFFISGKNEEEIKKEIAGIIDQNTLTHGDLLTDGKALETLSSNHAVLLLERMKLSKISDIQAKMDIIKKAGAELAGIVLLENNKKA